MRILREAGNVLYAGGWLPARFRERENHCYLYPTHDLLQLHNSPIFVSW
jgi:hypothetical protein